MKRFKEILLGICIIIFTKTGLSQSRNDIPLENISAETGMADSTMKARVNKINVTGNKKTRLYVILREVQFKEGDSLSLTNLAAILKKTKEQIYNTTLFYDVVVTFDAISQHLIDINVDVKERWYIYPTPQFQPVDRNLNEWIVKYKGDLERVNYGLKFQHFNLTGRRDILRAYLFNGYTRLASFTYTQPYSNKKLTEGYGIGALFSQSREIAYKTLPNNKLAFYKDKDFASKVFSIGFTYIIRKAIKGRHILGFNFSSVTNDPIIISNAYNPGYYNDSNTQQTLIDFSYAYTYNDVDNIIYPLKGTKFSTLLFKRGLQLKGGINAFSAEANYNKYWMWNNEWYPSLQFMGKVKLPFDLAYINQKALGYGENMLRGLQYYVIDGVAFGYVKSTLKKKLLSWSVPFPIKSKTHKTLPFRFFAKAFADAGYVYTKNKYETALSNHLLYTGGFGIDIITLYDINFRFEYSFNQLGQNGLFLQAQSGF